MFRMAKQTIIDLEHLKPLPVGDSDWAGFSQTSYTVDKTLLIKDLLDDNTKVALFTRPRRFGKTTALQMLKAFFEKAPKDTSFLFKDKLIWAAGEKYRREQGRYPIIYLTFKDVDGETFESAFTRIRKVMAAAVAEHAEALANVVEPDERRTLDDALNARGTVEDTGSVLGVLAKAVHLFTKKRLAAREDDRYAKPLILIDEYDAPVNKASVNGYLKEMTSLMRQFLSGALKDNNHVRMGIMTGVLRVAKEGILSGLNNPSVWTVFDEKYNSYFGFTEAEVSEMAEYYGVPEKMAEIKSWYDGYDFSGAEMYNPWSVLRYFLGNCIPKPYWLDTSSNDIITEIVRDLPHDTAETLEDLLRDGRALVPMTAELGPYSQIRNRPSTLYALLVSSGYLKVVSAQNGEELPEGQALVKIPNREIEKVFVNDIIEKARDYTGHGESDAISGAIVRRNPEKFRDAIQRFLTESVSFFDGAAEGFYHGMVLGFLAVLRNRYLVRSNRESGNGRFDIALFPLVADFPGVIIEIKHAKGEADDLKQLAQEACDQIDKKEYATEMSAVGVTDILKLGLAFRGKQVELVRG